ncbi:hypothetical protein [Pseudomonas sp.]|uniref:hypothetical protein n=1 Tax=Pseudomonas sp. TaxID=306 RepID=UPI003241D5E0
MQTNELSFAGKFDNGLSKVLCIALRGLKFALLWLMGLMMLSLLPFVIFEYSEGSSDLSLLEWLFMPLMCLLLWRHIHYSKHFGVGFWAGLSRLFIFVGLLTVVEVLIFDEAVGMIASCDFTDEGIPNMQSIINYLAVHNPLPAPLYYGLFLATFFLSAPYQAKVPADNKKPEKNEPLPPTAAQTRQEPTV